MAYILLNIDMTNTDQVQGTVSSGMSYRRVEVSGLAAGAIV